MGFFSDRVPLLSLGRKKAFLKRIQAAEQQVQQGEWLAELNQYIRKTTSSYLANFKYAGKIGEGEYGEVHLMRDRAGKEYALKMMEATEADCQYIVSEALLWRRVDSCTVARLYDAFSIGPLCFFLLELGGITLDVWIQKKLPKASPDAVLSHMLVLLCSLDALHNGAGIIHGDLKPDNVVRCTRSLLKLVDFGCAAVIDPRGAQQVGPEGSMAFMAPEKMFHGQDGPAADIYSLGGILYQLAFGYDSFPYCPQERFTNCYGSHEEAVADWQDALQRCDFIVPDVAYLPNSIMPAVLELLRGMLARAPAQRWTLEQCVASPVFSDELLAKMRADMPELRQHVDHFTDIRTAARYSTHAGLAALLDGASSCDDGSVTSRTPSVSSIASNGSYCSHGTSAKHHQRTPSSISSINIRPAGPWRSASAGSLHELDAVSTSSSGSSCGQQQDAHFGGRGAHRHTPLYPLPASPPETPLARGGSGSAVAAEIQAADHDTARSRDQQAQQGRSALLEQVLACLQRPSVVHEGDGAATTGAQQQQCQRGAWRAIWRKAGDAQQQQQQQPSVLLTKAPAPARAAQVASVADVADFKIAARILA